MVCPGFLSSPSQLTVLGEERGLLLVSNCSAAASASQQQVLQGTAGSATSQSRRAWGQAYACLFLQLIAVFRCAGTIKKKAAAHKLLAVLQHNEVLCFPRCRISLYRIREGNWPDTNSCFTPNAVEMRRESHTSLSFQAGKRVVGS